MKQNKKIILITGCSRGIGYETVKLLAQKKFKVYAGVRSVDNCENLISLANIYDNIFIRKIDLQDNSSIEFFFQEITNNNEQIDVFINNAGAIIFGPVETISQQELYEQFQINLFSPIFIIQKLIPLMRENKKGHIIFIGSTSGIKSHGMYGAYAATKFATEAIGHSLAVNLYKWGIKVSIIELSATDTLLADKGLKMGTRLKDLENPYFHYTNNTLKSLKKILSNGAQPNEVAKNILKVISNNSTQLRYFATKKSKKIFIKCTKDPFNKGWEQEARESLTFWDLHDL